MKYMFNKLEFSAVQNWTSSLMPVTAHLFHHVIDRSGNNSFKIYFTTNLAIGNYNFVTLSGGSGINMLKKNTTYN